MRNMELKDIRIYETDDMDSLNDFFEENLLEISEDEPVETSVIKAWRADDKNGNLVGGVCLAFREKEFIIDGIAVDTDLRGIGLGEKLLSLATDEVEKRSGNKIFLVAKAPEFFKTQGYVEVEPEAAPMFYECAGCDQYNVTCFPKVMKWEE